MINMHNARIFARVIHSLDIHFQQPVGDKFYLVVLGFTQSLGYMVSYKGSDMLHHFQQFRDEATSLRRIFQNARERFSLR